MTTSNRKILLATILTSDKLTSVMSDQSHQLALDPSVTSSTNEVSTPYLAYVGINEAARLIGRGKQQIYRDIDAGKLSWHVGTNGRKVLQLADLDRVYGIKSSTVPSHKPANENRLLPPALATETAVELAVLKERATRLEEENRDLKHVRDRLLNDNGQLTRLLAAPQPELTPTLPWWKRLFS